MGFLRLLVPALRAERAAQADVVRNIFLLLDLPLQLRQMARQVVVGFEFLVEGAHLCEVGHLRHLLYFIAVVAFNRARTMRVGRRPVAIAFLPLLDLVVHLFLNKVDDSCRDSWLIGIKLGNVRGLHERN